MRVFGLPASDPASSVEIRRRTGFVSEDKDLYDDMTVAEIIAFTARCYPRWRTDLQERYVRAFELPVATRVKALSRGTRTKLALLLAFCRGADLLVLDEPTSGLDPVVAEEVLQLLVSHVAREETTVFLSSHQLAEVDQIADRIGDHPPRPDGADRRAGRPAGIIPARADRLRARRAGRDVPHAGRRAACGARDAC